MALLLPFDLLKRTREAAAVRQAPRPEPEPRPTPRGFTVDEQVDDAPNVTPWHPRESLPKPPPLPQQYESSADEAAAGRADLARLRRGEAPAPEAAPFEVPGQSLGGIARRAAEASGFGITPATNEELTRRYAPVQERLDAGTWKGLPNAGAGLFDPNLGQLGTAAPEDAPFAVQEALRPTNYIMPVGPGALGVAKGVGGAIAGRYLGRAAEQALPEDAPPWARTGAELAGNVAGFGLGAGAVGGVAGIARGAEEQATTQALRRAAPEAFEVGRGGLDPAGRLRSASAAPEDVIAPFTLDRGPGGLIAEPQGVGIPSDLPRPTRQAPPLPAGGAGESTGRLPAQLPDQAAPRPLTTRQKAALARRAAEGTLSDKDRELLMNELGRAMGATTPAEREAMAPWNAPAGPPGIEDALGNARQRDRVEAVLNSPQARALRTVREQLADPNLPANDRTLIGATEYRLEETLGVPHAYTGPWNPTGINTTPSANPTQAALEGMAEPRQLPRPENVPAEQQGSLFDRERYRARFNRPEQPPLPLPDFPLNPQGPAGGSVETLGTPSEIARRIPREQWVSPAQIETRPDLFQARDAPVGQATDPRRVQSIVDSFDPERFEPLTVAHTPEGGYVVISGHHRLEAAKRLGLPEIPVRVVEGDLASSAERAHLQNEAAVSNFLTAKQNVREEYRAYRTLEQNGMTTDQIAAEVRRSANDVERVLDIGRAGPGVVERVVSIPQTADVAAEVGRAARLYAISPDDAFGLFEAFVRKGKGESLPSAMAVRTQLERLAPVLQQQGLPGFEGALGGSNIPLYDAVREAVQVQDELLRAERKLIGELRGARNLARRTGADVSAAAQAGEAELQTIRQRLTDVESEVVERVTRRAGGGLPEAPAAAEAAAPAQQTGVGLFDQSNEARNALSASESNRLPWSQSPAEPRRSQAGESAQGTSVSNASLPGDVSTTRINTPSNLTGPSSTLPATGAPPSRIIVQHAANDERVLTALAHQEKPDFDNALTEMFGDGFIASRVKRNFERMGQKLADREPNQLGDYLGARVATDDPQAALAQLEARFGKGLEVDTFNRPDGYRATHVQIPTNTPGLSAEVQLLEPRIAAMQEEAHKFYERARELAHDDPQYQRLQAAMRHLYEHGPDVDAGTAAAMQRAAHSAAPAPELEQVIDEARAIAAGRPLPQEFPAGAATQGNLIEPPPRPVPPSGTVGGSFPPDGTATAGRLAGMEPPPPPKRTFGARLLDAMGVPISAKSTYDLSAPGRQLAPMLYAHPTAIDDVLKAQWRALRSQDAFDASQQALRTAPHARLRELAGVELGGITDGLTREEQISSDLAQRLIPKARRFNDAYTAAVNEGRDWLFQTMLAEVDRSLLTEAGLKAGGLEELKRIGRLVNASTGRGDLAAILTENKILGQPLLWAPKLLAGRVQLVGSMFSRDPRIRAEAARQVVAFAGVNLAVLGAIKASGVADVELDPRSSDWGTIRIGERRWDPWAGYKPLVNLVARMGVSAKNQLGAATGLVSSDTPNMKGINSASGDGGLYSKSAFDVATNFLRAKLAPLPGEVWNQVAGKDVTGHDVNDGPAFGFSPEGTPGKVVGRISNTAIGLLAPIFLESISQELADTVPRGYERGGIGGAATEFGRTVAANVPYFFGTGGGYYEPSPEDRAATGEYGKLKGDEQLQAVRAEGWRKLREDAKAPDDVKGSRDYYAWADAKRAEWLPGAREWAQKAGKNEGDALAAVEKRLGADPTTKAYAAVRRRLEDDWIRANPQQALDNWTRYQALKTEDERKAHREWQINEEQRAIAYKTLAGRK